MSEPRSTRHFRWPSTARLLAQLAAPLQIDVSRTQFVGTGIELRPPLLQPILPASRDLRDYLDTLPAEPDVHVVLLLRVGAAAAGVWRGDQCLAHKAWKTYAVRGSGKAQTTYLRSKGKSRAGSRLRLRNAASLIEDVHQRLLEWIEQDAPQTLFYAASVRPWHELLRCSPPVLESLGSRKIPYSTHEPLHQELLRVRELLCRGKLTFTSDAIPEGLLADILHQS